MPSTAGAGLPAGVTLKPSALGGYAVHWKGEFVGWIHRNGPDRWNAYRRAEPPRPGEFLGAFAQDDAVERIARKAGWAGPACDRRRSAPG
ncbi:hypothetical protein [Paractinoplanes lichenicola]|uniref:Uncharacterized protein n=1 Tax=Paractinoplanes lichenicola TaxID=2802976 RepID=A0ABS1VX62_9ACTN|nr:hypothetical protein [Actinoplanes lichenicola]MBL7259076.1 hypothetical protein [Actinoplanes lichenicola]